MRAMSNPSNSVEWPEWNARPRLVDPRQRTEITSKNLLTYRSGLTYGDAMPAHRASPRGRRGGDIDSHVTPDDWIAGLAALPLIDQPGRHSTWPLHRVARIAHRAHR